VFPCRDFNHATNMCGDKHQAFDVLALQYALKFASYFKSLFGIKSSSCKYREAQAPSSMEVNNLLGKWELKSLGKGNNLCTSREIDQSASLHIQQESYLSRVQIHVFNDLGLTLQTPGKHHWDHHGHQSPECIEFIILAVTISILACEYDIAIWTRDPQHFSPSAFSLQFATSFVIISALNG
jgi:hypothetical protein